MSIAVRLIGGPLAGDTMTWKGGPVIKAPKSPDFVSLDSSGMETIQVHEYRIHKTEFGSGHVHYYGHSSPSAAYALNELWDEYRALLKQAGSRAKP